MARNFVSDGKIIAIIAPYVRTSGRGILVGSLFGVCLTGIATATNFAPENAVSIVQNTTTDVRFGANLDGFLQAAIDDARIYDRALPASEVSALQTQLVASNPPPPPPTQFACSDRQGTVEPAGNIGWGRLNIQAGVPTTSSFNLLKTYQLGQIAHDTDRNIDVAFISGLTLESPHGAETWSVVPTTQCPPYRALGALFYDAANQQMVLWGGGNSIRGPTDETWIYDGDWHLLVSGSQSIIDLRALVHTINADLETLRWNAWKRLEWQTTGKAGAPAPASLISSLVTLKANITAAKNAATAAEAALTGYEQTEAAAVKNWLAAAEAEAAAIGPGIQAGTLSGIEADYRALVGLRVEVLTAADFIRAAPPPHHSFTVTYNAGAGGFQTTLGSEAWLYRVADRRWERTSLAIGTVVADTQPGGEYVLRDVPTVAHLQAYQASQAAWAASIPANTWVIAPTNGTGRPNWGRTWSSLTHDPAREQLIYNGGGHGSEHCNITDHYDFRTGRWFRSDQNECPAIVVNSYFGWGRGYNFAPWQIHTYKYHFWLNPLTGHFERDDLKTPDAVPVGSVNDYNPDTGKWAKDFPTQTQQMPVPGVTGGLVTVNGWVYGQGPTANATVTLRTSGGTTQWANVGPIPYPEDFNDGYGFFYDPPRNRIMYYGGGYGGDLSAIKMMAFDLDTGGPWVNQNATVTGGGALPKPYREWVYIPRYDRFLTMRRFSGAAEVWEYNPTTSEFALVPLALGPGVAEGTGPGNLVGNDVSSGLAYDPVSDVAFYIHGTSAGGVPTMFAFRYVPTGGASLNVPLTTQEALAAGVPGLARTDELVSVGVPLPETSGINSVSQLGLAGAAAGQFRALAHWPNGNVRWVLASFLASAPAPIVTLTNGTGNFGGAALATDTGATIAVNTGPAQFTIRKANFNVLDSVDVNGQSFVTPGNAGKLVMRNAANAEFSSANDAASTCVIEDNGPVKAVAKCSGSFKNGSGARLAGYIMRLTFAKGSAGVSAQYVITNADVTSGAANNINFNSVEAQVPVNLGATKTVEFARKTDVASGALGTGETAYLFQGHTTDKEYNTGCYLWKPPVAGTCDGNFNYQFDQTKVGLDIKIGATSYNSPGSNTDWTQGWGELRDSTGKGVTVALRWMSSYWPAGFEFKDDGSVTIGTFDKHNTKTDLAFVFGKNDMREIAWDFHTAAVNNQAVLFRLQHPLIARAPFEQYRTAGAFFGQSELVTPAQQAQFFNDVGHPELSPSLANPAFSVLYRFYQWMEGGGPNQIDNAHADLLDWVRTGNVGFYVRGEQQTQFNNTQVVHSENGTLPPAFDPDPIWGGSLNGGYIDMEHAHIPAQFTYYFMSGDEWIKDGILDYGEFLLWTDTAHPYFQMPHNNSYARAWDRKFRNMALVYEFTAQIGAPVTAYANSVVASANYLLDSRDDPGPPPVLTTRGRNLARGYRYWNSTVAEVEGYRMTTALFDNQIHPDAVYQVVRALRDTEFPYARLGELEDYLQDDLPRFIFGEAYRTKNAGTALFDYGFAYFFKLDSPSSPSDELLPYDAGRAAVEGYKATGDGTYLANAGKLLWGITSYATPRSPSELQDQALMYAHFN